jgi:hypothetical protein
MISGLCEIILYSLASRPHLPDPLGRAPCWAVKPTNGGKASTLHTNASRVALFLWVSDLNVHHLLLPSRRTYTGTSAFGGVLATMCGRSFISSI